MKHSIQVSLSSPPTLCYHIFGGKEKVQIQSNVNGCLKDLDVHPRDVHINFVVDCARTGQIASRKCRLRNSVLLSQDFTTSVYAAREKSLFHLHGKRVLGIWRKWVTMNAIYPKHNLSSLSNLCSLKPRDPFFTLLGRKKNRQRKCNSTLQSEFRRC